jgi:hypothetical protein
MTSSLSPFNGMAGDRCGQHGPQPFYCSDHRAPAATMEVAFATAAVAPVNCHSCRQDRAGHIVTKGYITLRKYGTSLFA